MKLSVLIMLILVLVSFKMVEIVPGLQDHKCYIYAAAEISSRILFMYYYYIHVQALFIMYVSVPVL